MCNRKKKDIGKQTYINKYKKENRRFSSYLFKNIATESSQRWSRTKGCTRLSARRQTERATCKQALDFPPDC